MARFTTVIILTEIFAVIFQTGLTRWALITVIDFWRPRQKRIVSTEIDLPFLYKGEKRTCQYNLPEFLVEPDVVTTIKSESGLQPGGITSSSLSRFQHRRLPAQSASLQETTEGKS